MNWELASLILQSIGVAQSIIWALFLTTSKRLNKPGSQLIGVLFVLFGIRVVKSMIYLHSNNSSEWIYNLGFAAHFFIGPVLAIYFYHTILHKRLPGKYFHLLPGIAILLLSFNITLENFWYQGGYSVLLVQSLSYLTISIHLLVKKRSTLNKKMFLWMMLLSVGFGVILFFYFANYILGIVDYSLAPTLFALIIIVLSFYLFQQQENILIHRGKYKNVNLDEKVLETYTLKIINQYQVGNNYLDQDYSLGKLSTETNIPKHIISNVFSQKLGASFIDYTNQARIETAKKKLLDENHLTISAIAYDSGFNSISSFNKAFKKFTGSTPSSYRSELQGP